jgi:DNA modification methylase
MKINTIYNEPNMNTMAQMPDKFINGVITSPPYNIVTKRSDCYYNNGYSDIDGLTEEQYIEVRLKEFNEFNRIIIDKGVILYNISYHNENPILPILLLSEIHKQTNLTLADMISWKKPHSIPFQTSPNKLSRIVEQVYVIVNKQHLQDFKANKTISKINAKTGQKFYKNYVNYVEAKNNDGIKCDLKASYSTELVSKLIDIYFEPNSTIYDPFNGIGTTALACKTKGLNYIASEINEDFYNITLDRLK